MKNMKNYNTVNTKNGRAIVADTQTELENIAKQVSGDVVILTRRDGEDSYGELGIISLPYRFGGKNFTAEEMYGDDNNAYYVSNLGDYYQTLRDEKAQTDMSVIWEITTLKDGDIMLIRFINGEQVFDTFREEQTRWHNADVNEYRLAVVTE